MHHEGRKDRLRTTGHAGEEIGKVYVIGNFWNFYQISLAIVGRALAVEWGNSFS